MKKIAHRGYSEKYPENTLLAFEKAIEHGAHMIELDIHLSKDGIPVVIHDDYINRTSNGQGMVKDLTLEELRAFNYNNGNSACGDQAIPTLEDVLDLVKGKAELNIEIKKCPVKYDKIEAALVELLKKKGFLESAIISSFDHFSLRIIKDIEPVIKTGMLYDSEWLMFRQEVEALDLYSIHPNVDVVEPGQVKWAKEKGLKVYPWVAYNRGTIERLSVMGLVDGIMVNELELFGE
ncbi:MAG: glycerophosphodiester phosphodiesterase [bacterium]|nr:glycerophosphodiester phosphodiesterase [bacterium]